MVSQALSLILMNSPLLLNKLESKPKDQIGEKKNTTTLKISIPGDMARIQIYGF